MSVYTDIFTNNYLEPNIADISFKDIIRDKDLWLLNGEKDSSVLVINRIDYNNIMQKMIHDGIKNKIHQQTADNTLNFLRVSVKL